MSLLHPTEEDNEMADAARDSSMRKALNRVWRLTFLLRQIRDLASIANGTDKDFISLVLSSTWRDETDDNRWRLDEPISDLPRAPGEKAKPCGKQSDVCDAIEQPLECERDAGHDGLHHCKFGRASVTWSD